MPETQEDPGRSPKVAAMEALFWIYVPQLTPFALGMVKPGDGTFDILVKLYVLLPGTLFGVLIGGESYFYYVVSAIATFIAFLIAFNMLDSVKSWGARLFLGLLIGVFSGANVYAFASALLA